MSACTGRHTTRFIGASAVVALVALVASRDDAPVGTLSATAVTPDATAALNGIPSVAILPDGGTLTLDLQSPTAIDATTVQLDAAISLTPAATASQSLVFTVDVSGSAFTTDAGCGGDFNRDGITNSVLDCELAAAWDTIGEAGSWGVAEVGVLVFETFGRAGDVKPQSGKQRFTSPTADLNGNGELDLETVLRSAGEFAGIFRPEHGLLQFTKVSASSVLGGGTNFKEASRETCAMFGFASQPSRTALFLSDGDGYFGGAVTGVLPCAASGTIHTVAVGPDSDCALDRRGYGSLDEIAALGGGTCTHVTDPTELSGVLQGLVLPGVDRVTLSINGGAAVDVSDGVATGLPQLGASTLAFSDQVSGLTGDDELCLTVHSTDPSSSRETSVTECVNLATNTAPIANAGPDLVVTEGDLAELDGTGSADADGDALTYLWELDAASGPLLVIPGAVLPTTVIQTLDDGDYLLTLTVSDGTTSSSDTASLTVLNDEPIAAMQIDGAMADGIALLTASFTEEGVADTHTATVNWGDGSGTETVSVSAQGTGWGSLFASHVYAAAGTFSVTLIVTDDDGGTDAEVGSVTITPTVGVFAGGTTGDAFDWTGGTGSIQGLVHSNAGVRVRGTSKSLVGGVEYVTAVSIPSSTTVTPAAGVSTNQTAPITYTLADYAPAGRAAVQAGAAYHDMSSSCSASAWQVSTALAPGLYYANCDVHMLGTQSEVTVVSTGTIQVSKQGSNLRPYSDGLLFLAGNEIQVSAASGTYLGHLVAGGAFSASGANNRFLCGIVANTINLSGSSFRIEGSDCVRPDRTTAPPTLVPSLSVSFDNSPDEVNPSALVSSEVTIENDSTLLLVPGVVGLQNHGTASVTVTSGTVTLEVLEAGATTWTTIPASVTLVTDANTATGVTYVGNAFAGAVLSAGSLASWGAQLQVDLDPATVAWLLDPIQVQAVRTHVEFAVNDASAPARTLYRFGDDISGALRDLGASVRDIEVTLTTIDGTTRVLSAASSTLPATLDPGESVTVSADGAAPTMAAIGSSESAAAYLDRLLSFDGAGLGALVSVRAEGGVGHVLGPQVLARTTLAVPVIDTAFTFPDEATATATIPVPATASNVSATTAYAPSATTGVSSSSSTSSDSVLFDSPLGSGGIDSATASLILDAAFGGLNTTISGSWTWQDAAGNTYGPASFEDTLFVDIAPALQATLVDELVDDADGNGVIGAGDTVRYRGTVRNTGTASVSAVLVTLALDPNTSLISSSGTTSHGYPIETGDTLEASLGTLTGTQTASFSVDARITDAIAPTVGALSVQGVVTASAVDTVLTDDPGTAGDADPTTTPLSTDLAVVVAVLDDRLTVDADLDGEISAGDTLHYVVGVQVVGDTNAQGVAFALTPSSGSTLTVSSVVTDTGSVTTGNGTGDTSILVNLGTVAGLSVAMIGFDVTVTGGPAVTLSTQGTVTADGLADVLTDDPYTAELADPTLTELGGHVDAAGSPVLSLTSPLDGERVAAPTDLAASATPDGTSTIESWTVAVYPAGGDSAAGTLIASGTGELPASLGLFDPTILENGAWTVRAEATDSLGRIGSGEATVVVDGDMKLGSYDLGFVDADWHSSVTAVTLLRSYSTLRKGEVGDFGNGWRLSMLDFTVQRNGPLGDGGWSQETCGSGFIYYPVCTVSSAPHLVTVRWPDGHVEAWDFTPEAGSSYFAMLAGSAFTPRAGTTSSLESADSGSVAFYGGDLYTFITLADLYDPQQYWLTDRDGTMYLLDLNDGLLQIVDRNGNTTDFSDDGIVPDRGVGVEFVRDGEGRMTSMVLPDGNEIAYSYDAAGDLVSVTDQVGDVTEFDYDGAHRLTSYNVVGRAPVAAVTYDYDADGRLLSREDASGVFVEHGVDLAGFSETTLGPDPDLTAVATYDADGQLVSLVESFDGESLETTWVYDANYRPITVAFPGGGTLSLEYDTAGRVTSLLDPDDVLTEWSYNGAGDVLSVAVDGVIKTEATYDAAGNRLTQLLADGTELSATVYDTWGGPLTWTDADGGTGSVLYDAASQIRGFVANGRTVDFTLDAFGRAVSATDAQGNYGLATYDARGEMTEFTDPNGHVERWTYDDRGFLVSTTDKAARDNAFTYDEAGQLLSETTRLGEVVEYSYDSAGRTVRIEGPDVYVAYAYDPLGRLTGVENAEQTIAITYDARGNVASEAVTPVVTDAYPLTTMMYAWSDGGRLLSSSSQAGNRTFGYDTQGRIDTLSDSLAGTTSFAWDSDDRLVSIGRSTGLSTALSYTALGRLSSLSTTADGVLVDSYGLTRSADGRIDAKTDSDGEHAFAYDERGQLTDASHPSASGLTDETYAYDANGNRTAWAGNDAADVGHDADILEGDAAFSYTHDHEGRLSTKVDTNSLDTTTYHWNSFDQLVSIEAPEGETTFAYDGLGRRIEVNHLGDVSRFAYDGDEVRAVYDGDNALVTWRSTDPAGGLLAEYDAATDTVRDALLDQLGTRRGWVTGGAVERTARDSFGNPASVGGSVEPAALSWHAQDPTGLVYARARYLDPTTGRFLSEDPIQGANAYAYAGNDPISSWDPQGMEAEEEGGLISKNAGEAESERRVGIKVACKIFGVASAVGLIDVGFVAEIVIDKACEAAATGGNCFVAGTQVRVPGGRESIEALDVGDPVLGLSDGRAVNGVVRQTFVRYAGTLVVATFEYPDGHAETLRATPEHPFYLPAHRGYVELQYLDQGTRLLTADGNEAVLIGMSWRYGQFEVFNIEVERFHSYFVSEWGSDEAGIAVHNATYKPTGPCARRIPCQGKGDAYERAKRAGGGREPIHHPDGEHGPHYHPDVPDNRFPWSPDSPVPKTPSPHDHFNY